MQDMDAFLLGRRTYVSKAQVSQMPELNQSAWVRDGTDGSVAEAGLRFITTSMAIEALLLYFLGCWSRPA